MVRYKYRYIYIELDCNHTLTSQNLLLKLQNSIITNGGIFLEMQQKPYVIFLDPKFSVVRFAQRNFETLKMQVLCDIQRILGISCNITHISGSVFQMQKFILRNVEENSKVDLTREQKIDEK
ncbi:hypothetical protein SS50377_21275 [Spironucleus salmonicida]|uniref:Uncharacterized protein n=1 Tax=Spironucleus salmonicida TaxID=348837 RepID=A0A9P8M0T0_9EUKA|nr:hypothetical protein SS50377_21275 [Spironucleus salmonicida]